MVNTIIDTFDLWTTAQNLKTSNRGLSASNQSLLGIKKLRELILELAVRGKLVPQDTNDEPANILLKQIEAEKKRLVSCGQIKKQEALTEIKDNEKTFEIPEKWQWTRLGHISEIVRGITFSANEKSTIPEIGRVACLRTTNVQDRIEWDDLLFIREILVKRKDQFILKNDIVMSMANSRELVGKVAIVDETPSFKTAFGGFLGVLRPIIVDPFYLMLLLRVPTNRDSLIDSASQTTNIANISLAKLYPLPLAIPPLAEQHRIVAKVDELMALCDQLEQQQTNSNAAHQTLVDTLLGTLTNAENPAVFEEAWQRIANHFDTLLTTEHSIEQLKQTILQLAVMGKLVPQNPDDEPASELLKKIGKEKARLVKEGKIKKLEILPDVKNNDYPFEIPNEWLWQRLGNITTYGISLKAERKDVDSNTWILELEDIEKDTSRILQKVRVSERQFLSSKNRFYQGDVIYGKLRPYLDKVIVADEMGVCTTEMIPLNGYGNIANQYLRLVMKSPYFIKYATESTHGMNLPRLGTEKARLACFPLPPLDEQYSIVTKVDELFALCDTLKERLRDAQALQNELAMAVVEGG